MQNYKGELHLEGSHQDILNSLETLRKADEQAELKVAKGDSSLMNGLFLIVPGVCLVGFVATVSESGSLGTTEILLAGLGVALGLVGVILAVVGEASKSEASKFDLDNARYEELARFHERLQELSHSQARFSYRLNLLDYYHKSFRTSSKRFGGLFGRKRGTNSVYHMNILTGHCDLKEESQSSFRVSRVIWRKEWTEPGTNQSRRKKCTSRSQTEYELTRDLPEFHVKTSEEDERGKFSIQPLLELLDQSVYTTTA